MLRDARDLGINLSQACARGLAAEVMALRRQRWLQQNRDAIDGYNEHVARHGQPLACLCTRPAVLIAYADGFPERRLAAWSRRGPAFQRADHERRTVANAPVLSGQDVEARPPLR